MNLLNYLKDKVFFIFVWMIVLGIISLVLYVYHLPISVCMMFFIIAITPLLSWYAIDYMKKKLFYDSLQKTVDNLSKKYLIYNLIEEPKFLEGQILYDVLYETNKAMFDHLNEYKNQQQDYREYIETWVHEIKTPMTAARLVLRNIQEPNSLSEELDKMEEYVEQVLYYARSNNPEKDFLIRKIKIQDAINRVLQKNAKHFIQKGISLNMEPSEEIVYCDSKWIDFLIGQLISNAIKYSGSSHGVISISVYKTNQSVTLKIADNGVGISQKDLPRIFEKGFTGENGRTFGKSTGVGLYLCKKVADKLYLGLKIESAVNQGTSAYITFPLKEELALLES